MHHSSVIYVVEKIVSSLDSIIIPKCIIIDAYHICILMDNVPSNSNIFKQTPPKNKQILRNLLSEEGIYLLKTPCCQSRGLQGPFCSNFLSWDWWCQWRNPRLCRQPYNPKTYVRWFYECHPCLYDIYHQHPRWLWLPMS